MTYLVHAGRNLHVQDWSDFTGISVEEILKRMDVPGLKSTDILRPHRLSWWKINEKNSTNPELSERQRYDCYDIESFIVNRLFAFLQKDRYKHIPTLDKWLCVAKLCRALFVLPEPNISIFIGAHVPKDNTLYTDSVFEWANWTGHGYGTVLSHLHSDRLFVLEKIAHVVSLNKYALDIYDL
jgi:hypothetical protein